ncbi:MAG: NnrS family protein, partial [Deltaproteobacteria bacterium]|nr:NnrS family protein [Deltaproteobacteria bacterium]
MTSLPLASTARLAPPQDPPLRLAPASRELANAPAWRRDPWKVFFPLGLVLAWVGVLPWLLFGLGLTETYLSIFHAMVQVQGFLFCFAMGFLFTFLPRRTGTAPPSAIELVLCLMSPVALAALALAERWALSQLFWFLPLGVLIRFALSRMLHSRKRGQFPPAFLWVGMGLLCGVAGGVLAGVGGALGDDFMWLH